MWVFFFVDERTREKMDRIIVTHICHSPRKEPEWERTRARALFLSYEITKSPSSDGPRTRVNLSLSLPLSRARRSAKERRSRAKRVTQKKCGAQEKSPHENTILSSSSGKRKRDTFSAQTTTTRTYPLERMCLCTSSVAPCVKSTYEPCFFIFSHLTGVKIWRRRNSK